MKSMNRRQFLALGTKTLTGAGLALGSNPYWTLAHSANDPGAGGDYRAMVCLFLQGGCDGISLMVPTDNADYNEYARSRGELSVPQSELLGINARTFGLVSWEKHSNRTIALQQVFFSNIADIVCGYFLQTIAMKKI